MKRDELLKRLTHMRETIENGEYYPVLGASPETKLDDLDMLYSLINLLESITPINASQTFTNEQYYTTYIDDFEGMMKSNIAHGIADIIKDKMDVMIDDNPFRCETTWTGTIYILDKKKGV